MPKRVIVVTTKQAQRVVRLVTKRAGMTMEDLAKALNLSIHRTTQLAGAARKAGLIIPVRIAGRRVEWAHAERLSAEQQAAIERAKAAKAERNLRYRIKVAQMGDTHARDELADAPVVSAASAYAPLPFNCAAPSSVFAHAASFAA